MKIEEYYSYFPENSAIIEEVSKWSARYKQWLTPEELELKEAEAKRLGQYWGKTEQEEDAMFDAMLKSENDDKEECSVQAPIIEELKTIDPNDQELIDFLSSHEDVKPRIGEITAPTSPVKARKIKIPKNKLSPLESALITLFENASETKESSVCPKQIAQALLTIGGNRLTFPEWKRLKPITKAAIVQLAMLKLEEPKKRYYLVPFTMDVSKSLMDKAIANKLKNGDGVLSYIRESFKKSLKNTLNRDVDMFCTLEEGKNGENIHLHGSALLFLHEAMDSEAKKPKNFKTAFNRICGKRSESEKRAGHHVGVKSLTDRCTAINKRGFLNGTVNWGMYATKEAKEAGKDLSVSSALNKFAQWHYEEIQIQYDRIACDRGKIDFELELDKVDLDSFLEKHFPA